MNLSNSCCSSYSKNHSLLFTANLHKDGHCGGDQDSRGELFEPDVDLGMVACTCNPSTAGVGGRGLQDLTLP